ncbi:sensor domain-containing diguanylate cyclase [Pelomonas sp. KK5]|uniref:sensor domain-containing diguanylate cyclase n=1 Tax=Pelomonas sp. KK5 TaxID=1855730 RepID=UPI00097C8686|nr:sensor domain-containing diguanylate cyclase [Pelomonas sp. KK5]
MDNLFDHLATSVTQARTLEELTRPLLEMLEAVTGLESTYLTTIDLDGGTQSILYARNTLPSFTIPEQLTVPWDDTLCKRALDENKPFSNTVAEDWGDSAAAKALGIQTYVSTPVNVGEGGELYGTLCAASASRHVMDDQAQRALGLFARLIGQYVERERLLSQLVKVNEYLTQVALTDALTGLPNRRALQDSLARLLSQGKRQQAAVLVAFVDLDGFKAINDGHGHEAGDIFLTQVGQRLRDALRGGDLAARIGGDEFVVTGIGPQADINPDEACSAFQRRIDQSLRGHYLLAPDLDLDYAGASVGVLAVAPGTKDATEALRDADALMYKIKKVRKIEAAESAQSPK